MQQDLEQVDDLELELEQVKELYRKEKELNQQLLNSTSGADQDAGQEGAEVLAPGTSVAVRVTSGQMDQIFRQRFEAE